MESVPLLRTPVLRRRSPRRGALDACRHPAEFRRRAVELASLREKPVAAIARDSGISDLCPRNLSSTGFRGALVLPLSRLLGAGGGVLGLVFHGWDEADPAG